MAYESDSCHYKGSYRSFLSNLANDLTEKNLKQLKFLLKDDFGAGEIEQINEPLKYLEVLENKGLIKKDELNYLRKALNNIGRNDLEAKVNAFAQEYNKNVSIGASTYDNAGTDKEINQLTQTVDLKFNINATERNNLAEKTNELENNKLENKQDILLMDLSTSLKRFYLKRYEKIDELRPPLTSPDSVSILNRFVQLCVVDALELQLDAVYIDDKEQLLKKQSSYKITPYNEVFENKSSLILISGIAGIGKTWLLRKCLLDWSNNLLLKDIQLLFYLESRRFIQYKNVSSINELLKLYYKEVLNDCSICNYSTMLVIDGLDEFIYLHELLNNSSQSQYPIVNALSEIKNYKAVISGRIRDISQYQNTFIDCNDKLNIQVIGFNEEGINAYIENNVKEKKDDVKRVLKESPIAKAMASIPFYLSLMCTIIANFTQRNDCSFLTMTDLYASIFFYFLQKHINKNNKPVYKMMEGDSNKRFVFNICKVAYYLLNQSKIIFSSDEMKSLFDDFNKVEDRLFGFIERIETNFGYHYQFVHLTIMEFCASVYAYNNISSKVIMDNNKLRNCLPMICGLSNKNKNSFLKFLTDHGSTNPEQLTLNNVCDNVEVKIEINTNKCFFRTFYTQELFIECFYESQSSFTNEIKASIVERDWNISIKDGKTSYQVSCDTYFVNLINSDKRVIHLFVHKKVFSEEEKNLIKKCSTKAVNVTLLYPCEMGERESSNKIKQLTIECRAHQILENEFENFVPWFNICEELFIYVHDECNYLRKIWKWTGNLKLSVFRIAFRGRIWNSRKEFKKNAIHKK
ncbi:NACHT, LRR and PYD domains-containing protein 12 isoform X4 [Hydra vulgaris]|uniref:NACHT, LRR and PYD domains-containing protein 12 isoform X4 n=1 Tax=Hydra vulgaris TaxID=6087 RepID=A0ABM4DJE1_HYDVU